jgi:hypothetical protein
MIFQQGELPKGQLLYSDGGGGTTRQRIVLVFIAVLVLPADAPQPGTSLSVEELQKVRA